VQRGATNNYKFAIQGSRCKAVYFVDTCPLACLYVIFQAIKPLGIKKCNSILQIKVMPQQLNTKRLIVKVNTRLHSTNFESHSQCVRIASYVYMCTVIG
jgi:hypothetical protein